MATRYFAVLFDDDWLDRVIECSSKREALALCHGYGLHEYGCGELFVCAPDGSRFEREGYVKKEWPEQSEVARRLVEDLCAYPTENGRTARSNTRVYVEKWIDEETDK